MPRTKGTSSGTKAAWPLLSESIDDDVLARLAERADHVRADVARSSGDQPGHASASPSPSRTVPGRDLTRETRPSRTRENCHAPVTDGTPVQHATSRVRTAILALPPRPRRGQVPRQQSDRPSRSSSAGRSKHDSTRRELRRHRLDPHLSRAGAADDAGPRAVLRRHGARQDRPQHDDDELRGPRLDLRRLGALGLLDGLRRRRRRRACSATRCSTSGSRA